MGKKTLSHSSNGLIMLSLSGQNPYKQGFIVARALALFLIQISFLICCISDVNINPWNYAGKEIQSHSSIGQIMLRLSGKKKHYEPNFISTYSFYLSLCLIFLCVAVTILLELLKPDLFKNAFFDLMRYTSPPFYISFNIICFITLSSQDMLNLVTSVLSPAFNSTHQGELMLLSYMSSKRL